MSATFSNDVAAWLALQGEGVLGTSLFIGQLPPAPLDAVLLVETGGRGSDTAHRVRHLSLQVTARDADYAAARARAWAIHNLLDGPPTPRSMGSSKVLYSKAIQPPFSLGQDERQAWRFVCNFEFLTQY